MPYQSIAHRGASGYAPENTVASFEKAVELGFDFIELDVRLSKDGKLVVIHDADLSRTTNGNGFVKDLTVPELKRLDAGSWYSPEFAGEKIPLLEEVLFRFGDRIGLLIEMKSPENRPGMTEALSSVLTSHIAEGLKPSQIKVQSFHIEEMKKFHQLSPEISAGILLSKPLDMLQLASYSQFASFLSVHHLILTQSLINQAEFLGLDIFCWTIKEQFQFPEMQRLGVHGIISDEEYQNVDSRIYAFITPFLKGQYLFKTFFT